MLALSRKTTNCVSTLGQPFDQFSSPAVIKSSMVLTNQVSGVRSRKHEIGFLILSDAEAPPKKRTRIEMGLDSLSTTAPISVKEPVQHPGLPPPRPVLETSSTKQSSTHQSSVSYVRCSVCAFSSSKPAEVVAHAHVAHPSKPFACNICGRCFSEKGNLNKHHRTVHLRERKHSCKHCARSFAFLDGLNRHISMVHLDKRPFKCTVCLCPRQHSRAGFCPFTCGMRFKQKSHYSRHVRSVHHVKFPVPQ